MFNKLLKRLSLMFLAIPALTLSSCNLFGGISSSSQGPNPPSETSSESDSKESSESESSESIESIESEESSESESSEPNSIVDYEVYLAGSFTTPVWGADESTKFTGSNGTYVLTDYVFPAGHFKLNVFPVFQDGTKGSTLWIGYENIAEMPEGWVGSPDNIANTAGTYTLTYTIAEGASGDAGVLTIVETQEPYTEGLIIENGVVTGYEGIDNEIIIPSKYEGVPVTSIGDWAFYNCTSLTSINIPDSVTSISNYAFYHCTSLTSIIIPNSVTSIGDWAFASCTSLTSINIPNSVTSISNYAFYHCASFTSIIVPNSVTSIGDLAFASCTSLTSINVDSNNTHYSSIDGILYDKDATTLICCPGGKVGEVIIPNSVTSIGTYAFEHCTSLTSIIIPNSVTSIGYNTFFYCRSLTSINIPDSVTLIGDWAFASCYSLTSINVDSKNIYYTSIDGILYSNDATTLICCPGGKVGEVIIPNSVTSIGFFAFSGCTSLTSIIIPNSVTSICDGAFQYCISLTSINIPNSVTSIGYNAFENCTSLTSIDIPNSVISIGVGAFYGCTSLTSINIPNSVTLIDDYAFRNCDNLTIYCEAESQPSGWSLYWNPDNRPVIWGA